MRGIDCAVVGGDVDSSSDQVTLRGVVGHGRPEQELLRSLREAAPTAAVDWQMGVAEGPYCPALNLIRTYARPFGTAASGVEVGLKDNRTNLVDGDRVDIVAAVPDFPSYLQIDYFQGDGKVAHLRTATAGTPILAARSVATFYGGDVAFPYGTDVIVAIASSTALFTRDRPQEEMSTEYLRDLRAALNSATQRRAQVSAAAVMVRTNPKP
jgi:hypothetical protein